MPYVDEATRRRGRFRIVEEIGRNLANQEFTGRTVKGVCMSETMRDHLKPFVRTLGTKEYLRLPPTVRSTRQQLYPVFIDGALPRSDFRFAVEAPDSSMSYTLVTHL